MKVRLNSIIPFIFMLSLYVASISAFLKADEVRQAELGDFICDHCDLLNRWNYVGGFLLLFAIGFTIGLFKWTSQSKDKNEDDSNN